MIFRILIATMIAIPLLSAPAMDPHDLAEFHRHYNAFVRTYLGCPAAALRVEECRPAEGMFDAREFLAARKAAAGLFYLRER